MQETDTLFRPPVQVGPFDESILSLMDTVTCARLADPAELEAVYRMRHAAYVRSGMIDVHGGSGGSWSDPYDRSPGCMNMAVYVDGDLAGAIRLHHVTPSNPDCPSIGHMGDAISGWLDSGLTLVDCSRFAHGSVDRRHRLLPYVTLRIAALATLHFRADYSINLVQQRHAAFYERHFHAERAAVGHTHFNGAEFPVVLLRSSLRLLASTAPSTRSYLLSTRREREALFDDPACPRVRPSAREAISALSRQEAA